MTEVVKDNLLSVLANANSYNPPFRKQPPATPLHHFSGPIPFNFYDRHLDDALSLKRVIPLPLLPDYLSKKVDHVLDDFKKRGGLPLPLNQKTQGEFMDLTPPEVMTGRISMSELGYGYVSSVGRFAKTLASTWLIHPNTTQYLSTLEFTTRGTRVPRDVEGVYPFYSARFVPFHLQTPEISSSVDEQTKAAIEELAEKDLFTCLFFPMCADMASILGQMDSLSKSLSSSAYTNTDFPVSPGLHRNSPPCDASSTPWVLPRLPPKKAQVDQPQPSRKRGIEPKRGTDPKFSSIITAAGVIHHAWHRAVREDTTIILLNCGNYERIGIRHRESQTLFLSRMINVWDCKNPAYGRLHLGLLLSVVSDALDRFGQTYKRQADIPRPPTSKRPRDPDEPNTLRRSGRNKAKGFTNAMKREAKSTSDTARRALITALAPRDLALVSIKYQYFNSPVPAPCLRKGGVLSPQVVGESVKRWKASYEDSECCTLTFLSDLSDGATGRVHLARLEVTTADGVTLGEDVVVKAAAEPALQKRVRHEYTMYRQLWSQGVERIPMVYGLYEDIDNMVTFLVIEKLGMSFRDREPTDEEGLGRLLSVSHAERSLCLKTVRAIHQADVLHRDLRPENILFGLDGKPMIVDFDRARRKPTAALMKREIDALRLVLDGKRKGSLLFDSFDFEYESDMFETDSESSDSDTRSVDAQDQSP